MSPAYYAAGSIAGVCVRGRARSASLPVSLRGSVGRRQRDQPLVHQVTFCADRLRRGDALEELPQSADHPVVLRLGIQLERPAQRVQVRLGCERQAQDEHQGQGENRFLHADMMPEIPPWRTGT